MPESLLTRFVMPATSTLTPFKSWAHLDAMTAAERRPLAEQRAAQLASARNLLIHAYEETALYRDKLDDAGLDPASITTPAAFAAVPLTSKHELREGFPTRQVARSYRDAWLRYSNTSGTSGRPLVLAQDVDDIAWKYASILRSRRLAGVDPLGRQVRVTPNECQPHVPAGGASGRGRASLFRFLERRVLNPIVHKRDMLPPFWDGGAPVGPVDADATLARIARDEPVILTMYPLYAMLLARHLRRTGAAPPKVAGVLDFSGGLCTPAMRRYLSATFGQRTAQGCGGCEFARYAASCESDPDRMHLAEGYCLVETVRADGSPCAPGELGNVIVTSLHGYGMPILRLEPGDVGTIVEEPCACGRSSRRIEHHGRIQAVFRNAEGRFVTDRECWDALLCLPGVALFQLHQDSETRYRLAVYADPGEAVDDAALAHAVDGLVGRGATVDRVGTAITTEASGKLQLVKSATFEAFRPRMARRPVPVN
jgi:phenylacetate-CoA ligase